MKKQIYTLLACIAILPAHGMQYISVLPTPQRLTSLIGTTWQLWSAAEHCKNQQWDLLIADEYQRLNTILGVDCFSPAQESFNESLAKIKAGSTDYQPILERCSNLVKKRVDLRRPQDDIVKKSQILFWFQQYITLVKEYSYNQGCMRFASYILSTIQRQVKERLEVETNAIEDQLSVQVDGQQGSLEDREYEWLEARLKKVFNFQKILLGNYLSPSEYYKFKNHHQSLRIGIACSGGGYRAMTFSSGALAALEKLNIIASSLYISGLSGSTWFIAPWLISISPERNPQSIRNYRKELSTHIADTADIKQNAVNRTDGQLSEFIHDVVMPKAVLDKPVSSVDMFGGLLARALLSIAGNKPCHRYTMQDIQERIALAEVPFPIFTAISDTSLGMAQKDHKWYFWYEFTPYSVENIDCSLRIPQASFGSKFNEGAVTNETVLPEKLGSLMGMWGSAYTINFANKIDAHHLDALASWGIWAAKNLVPSVGRLSKEEQRFYPAVAHNPFFNLPAEVAQRRFVSEEQAATITGQETATFVDAGIDFNLPILPLLKKMRNLDVVIVVDASGDIERKSVTQTPYAKVCPNDLCKFFERVYEKGIEYKELPVGEVGFAAYIPLSGPASDEDYIASTLPVILYLNHETDVEALQEALHSKDKDLACLIRENDLLHFTPSECEAGYGNTFNFTYTTPQFNQLSAVGECKVLLHKDTIIKLLAAILRCKLDRKLNLERLVATTITPCGRFLNEDGRSPLIEKYDASLRNT